MDEFSFIDSIKQSTYKQPSLKKGIGDDGAVFRQSTEDIVTVVDTFVDQVHFSERTMNSSDVGYRSLAGTISDLAAMGATPAFYLVSIVVPHSLDKSELINIYSGMSIIANKFKLDLIGGDTVVGTELSISITAIGFVDEKLTRYRHTAKENDVVFVTGTVGDSQAGLFILTNEGKFKNKQYYIGRHRRPTPRIKLSEGLRIIPRVTLNDLSDGIATEAKEIAVASEMNILINDELVPTSQDYEQFPAHLQFEWKYFGGEDYELLGTVSKKDWNLVKQVAQDLKLKVTKIGEVEYNDKKCGQVIIKKDNKRNYLSRKGYTHF